VRLATSLPVIVLLLSDNVLLGAAVWRSGTLPRWAGVFLAAAAVFVCPLGIVHAIVIGGAWMARSVLRRPSAQTVGVQPLPRAQ
jgi:hypothetical protein